ncbi:hypothetical protein [Lacticaseibacillus nasuensis]|uniref:Uncharacterized protein n=1 Tax=Lacticaseibacillus nasuensis JCM 17158 TaxID=1291734 RepID=A0A0R1JP32_9LACO|nr:hypothetical protein [Lacticaseibacillus nasuensis]KRK73189.1 hypothetical protein FD02_GL001045 [Lacticaseibacillus nasuensis JCM 17158]
MREVDLRRDLLEQAVNIANISNGKNPKKAVRNGMRAIEKEERSVLNRDDRQVGKRPNMKLIQQVNEAFGGDANG